jgi:predicted enzyme related to lactoylglutathione lyase
MNLDNILIGSEDPDRLAAYYTKLLGEPTWSDASYTGWMVGSGAVSVGPHSEVKGRNPDPGRVIWNISTDDVKGDFERFKSAGATVVREPYTPDGTPEGMEMSIATFEDPDGNYFQLMTAMDPDQMP